MKGRTERFLLGSIKQKVAAGFILTIVALALAIGITQISFSRLLTNIDELATPNEKLTVLNKLFENITTVDQQQRAEAIRSPKDQLYKFQKQSSQLNQLIDSLLRMKWDTVQQQRLRSLKEMLGKRDNLFFAYLRLKANTELQNSYDERLDTLSTIIERSRVDTAIVSTQKRTVTTTLSDTVTGTKTKDDRKFMGKLFGKKKTEKPAESHVRVQQEFSIVVDTVAFSKHNNALAEVERILQNIELDQRARAEQLEHQELQLIHANSIFVGDLQRMVREVENEELQVMQQNGITTRALFNQTMTVIIIVIGVFCLLAALLTYFIWTDISKSNYYKVQLEQARDEAEELSRTKERFLANMSHEIRTPLQSIIGFAEQLQQKSNVTEATKAIYHSSEHLLHIVNEVLDYSRITSGKLILSTNPFLLVDVVDEVAGAMRVQAEKKQLDFQLQQDFDQSLMVQGDAFRLRQILYNLLGNAIKFTPRGSVKLMVSTQMHAELVDVTFEVIDTGIGIEQENLERIFNQFEQAHTFNRKQEAGTGLGLSIVKALVELQNGNLQVMSTPGAGSVFKVTLPYSCKERMLKESARLDSDQTQPIQPTIKVLVVDDDATILSLCSVILSKHQINHTIQQDAKVVLGAEPDPTVTHILLDIRMPHISGIELCKLLKEKYDQQVMYVALTAHVFPQEQQHLLQAGFDKVLSKPFREAELLNMLGIVGENILNEPAKQQRSFNPEVLRKMTMGDEQLYQSVIAQFLMETADDMILLNNALNKMDKMALREVIHKLAGRIGQLGVTTLSLRLRTIEDQLQKGGQQAALIERIISVRDEIVVLITEVEQTRIYEKQI